MDRVASSVEEQRRATNHRSTGNNGKRRAPTKKNPPKSNTQHATHKSKWERERERESRSERRIEWMNGPHHWPPSDRPTGALRAKRKEGPNNKKMNKKNEQNVESFCAEQRMLDMIHHDAVDMNHHQRFPSERRQCVAKASPKRRQCVAPLHDSLGP